MEWIRAVATILGGAAAGGLTNRVAVWMLFHPYRPPEIAGREVSWLQGAVPKNQDRLAASIGHAVGARLLTPEDLARGLREGGLREAFGGRLETGLRRLLEDEHPPPSEWLPEPALEEARGLLEGTLSGARPLLAEALESPGFARTADRALASLSETLDRETEDGPLPPERIREVRGRVEGWLDDAVSSDAFRDQVHRHLDRAAREILRPGRTLGEILPSGLTGALESAVAGYLPLLMERLGRLLEDPAARGRFQAAVDDLLQRFMRDLRFHQRVVARLIITEETVERVVDALQEEGAERLGELLREEDVQRAVARGVNDAVGDLLHRPAVEVLGRPEEERVRDLVERAGEWLVATVRSPGARGFLLDRLEEAAWRAEGATWGDLLRRIPADRLGSWLAGLLRSDAGRAVVEDAAGRLAGGLLHRPVRLPSELLGREAAERLTDLLAPPLWAWLSREIPGLAARVPVAEKVEEKIREFPLPRLEELVRSVTQRELDLIVRLGWILGAFIGGLLVAFDALLS
jgi:uncharacterized membrane-anchored protein YjiN (DUF445 family)